MKKNEVEKEFSTRVENPEQNQEQKAPDMNAPEKVVGEIIEANVYTPSKEEKKAYTSLLGKIDKAMVAMDKQFINMAMAIWEINKNQLFRVGYHKTIVECINEKFGFKKSTTYNFIGIVDRFCEIDAEKKKPIGLKEQWADFSVSKLTLLLKAPDEMLEEFTPDMTVKAIKGMINRAKETLIINAEAEPGPEEPVQQELDLESDSNIIDVLPEETSSFLGYFVSVEDLVNQKESFMQALSDFRRDKNFSGKNPRLSVSIVWD